MPNDLKILIAEDEVNISIALKAIIRKVYPTASINVVTNGREALDTIKVTTYQLIVSDWNMPVMTGIELLVALRNKKATMDIPFIMLTARGDKESVISALKNGVTEYIAKPFENQQVIDKVQKFLGYEDHEPDKSIYATDHMIIAGDIDSEIDNLLENTVNEDNY